MELNNIKGNTRWAEASGDVNDNNRKIVSEFSRLNLRVESAVKEVDDKISQAKLDIQYNKGIYATVADLKADYPDKSEKNKAGFFAFVGASNPRRKYKINVDKGSWIDTGEDHNVADVDIADYATKEELSFTPKMQTIATIDSYEWSQVTVIGIGTRLRTKNYVRVKQRSNIKLLLDSSYELGVALYDEKLNEVGSMGWYSNNAVFTPSYPYVQWTIRKPDNSLIDLSDLENINLSFEGDLPEYEIAPSVIDVQPIVNSYPATQEKVNNTDLISAQKTISDFGEWRQSGVDDVEGTRLASISVRNYLRNIVGSKVTVSINPDYRVAFVYYDENLNRKGQDGWLLNGQSAIVNYPYLGINITAIDGGIVKPEDIALIEFSLQGNVALYDVVASNLEVKELKRKALNSALKTNNRDLGHLIFQPIGGKDNSLIVYYGQSLADGTETGGIATTTAINGNYMIGNSANIEAAGANPFLKPLIATLFSATFTGGEQPIVSCTNSLSQLYRKFVDANQKFITASCGRGSQSITELLDENGIYKTNFLYALDKSVELTTNNVDCSVIVFMQGEKDYGTDPDAINDKEGYKAKLLELKNKMQADVIAKTGQKFPPLFFIYQTSTGFIQNDKCTISQAQLEFSEENSDVILLNACYPVTSYNNANKRAHLTINGSRWYGEMCAKTIFQTLVNGRDYSSVKPINFNIEDDKIIIDMKVPYPPLVIDNYTVEEVYGYGFRVTMDNAHQDISKVSIKGNSVILECANTLSGIVSVAYAPASRSGRGNIRDSDSFISLYKFVEDSTEVSRWNNPIGYRAKDKDGNVMTGKNYPLCNWLSPFYKKIN